MNYKINITRKAEADLNSAADYITFCLLNPTAANNLLDKAEQEINALAFMPQKHPLADDSALKALGIRFITVNNYIAFYTIDEDISTVHIIRFLYCKRNWIQILKNEC